MVLGPNVKVKNLRKLILFRLLWNWKLMDTYYTARNPFSLWQEFSYYRILGSLKITKWERHFVPNSGTVYNLPFWTLQCSKWMPFFTICEATFRSTLFSDVNLHRDVPPVCCFDWPLLQDNPTEIQLRAQIMRPPNRNRSRYFWFPTAPTTKQLASTTLLFKHFIQFRSFLILAFDI